MVPQSWNLLNHGKSAPLGLNIVGQWGSSCNLSHGKWQLKPPIRSGTVPRIQRPWGYSDGILSVEIVHQCHFQIPPHEAELTIVIPTKFTPTMVHSDYHPDLNWASCSPNPISCPRLLSWICWAPKTNKPLSLYIYSRKWWTVHVEKIQHHLKQVHDCYDWSAYSPIYS